MHQRQRGVAVVTALLVTALAVTLVTDLFWQQQVALRSVAGQRLRLQARLALRAGLDGAALILRDSGAAQGRVTTLEGEWSRRVADRHLERFDGLGGDVDAIGDAQLAQQTTDAQARYNLRNLVKNGAVDTFELAAFARLLATLHADAGLARATAQALLPGSQRVLTQCDDLAAVPGFSAATLAALRPYIVLLPEATAVNVNTAGAEVLTAVSTLTLAQARALVQARTQAHFKDTADFALRLNDAQTLEGVRFDVTSDYFLVASEVRHATVRLRTEALIRRRASTTLLWIHET